MLLQNRGFNKIIIINIIEVIFQQQIFKFYPKIVVMEIFLLLMDDCFMFLLENIASEQ